MKKTYNMKKGWLHQNTLLYGTIIWWALFTFLAVIPLGYLNLLNIVGFTFLAIVPGALTVLILRLDNLSFWARLSLSVALSLLELMIIALLGNYILPKFGVVHPLNQTPLIIETGVLLWVLLIVCSYRLHDWEFNFKEMLIKVFPTRLDQWMSFLPILFVLQSLIGVLELNNGGAGTIILVMLGEIAIFLALLFWHSKKLAEDTIPIALFFIGLAMLFMTSMRGWYITGHDIQQEYKVFELTKNANLWSMSFFRDPYSACLSITILPTIFFNLLKVSDPYVFKFFFQFFFALTPGIIYMISRLWANKRFAVLSSIYFIGFPTFFIDMPFLVRQEIAFIYYGLMLYIIFEQKIPLKMRQVLFVVMGIGVILSHYSTTYTVLMVFTFAIVARPIVKWLFKVIKNKTRLFNNSALQVETGFLKSKPNITIGLVVLLFTLAFIWTTVLTDTSHNLGLVIKQTFSAIGNGATENTRSTDIANLVSLNKPSQQQELDAFINTVIIPERIKAPAGTFFDESLYGKYKFTALSDENISIPKLGAFVTKYNPNFVTTVTFIGRILAKFMEVLVPFGVLYLLFSRSALKYIDDEFYVLGLCALVFIFLIIIVPILSTQYGVFRAMQQSLYILAIPMAAGSMLIGGTLYSYLAQPLYLVYVKMRKIKMKEFKKSTFVAYSSIFLAFLFFIYSTSFVLQLFGGNPALLYLSNAGRYYDNYLIKTSEIDGVAWLNTLQKDNTNGVKLQIQADRYSQKKIASISNIGASSEIFPGIVQKNAYVFIGEAIVKKQRATIVIGGDQITYAYPIQFLDQNKSLIYNNGNSRVYR